MHTRIASLAGLFLFWLTLSASAANETFVNGTAVPMHELDALTNRIGYRPQPGHWWYDTQTGAFGNIGGPTLGFLPPALGIGGPLRADASGGGDGRYGGVFINGREIHPQDIAGLQALLGQVIPGRYWVDAAGNFGYEGGYPIGNLWALAQASGRGGRGPRGSAPSTCGTDPSCASSKSWLGDNYFSDGKTGCIVMEGEISC